MKTFEEYWDDSDQVEVPYYLLGIALGSIPCPHNRDDCCAECDRKTWDALQSCFDYRYFDEGILP